MSPGSLLILGPGCIPDSSESRDSRAAINTAWPPRFIVRYIIVLLLLLQEKKTEGNINEETGVREDAIHTVVLFRANAQNPLASRIFN